jgi:hypothetical protein
MVRHDFAMRVSIESVSRTTQYPWTYEGAAQTPPALRIARRVEEGLQGSGVLSALSSSLCQLPCR